MGGEGKGWTYDLCLLCGELLLGLGEHGGELLLLGLADVPVLLALLSSTTETRTYKIKRETISTWEGPTSRWFHLHLASSTSTQVNEETHEKALSDATDPAPSLEAIRMATGWM